MALGWLLEFSSPALSSHCMTARWLAAATQTRVTETPNALPVTNLPIYQSIVDCILHGLVSFFNSCWKQIWQTQSKQFKTITLHHTSQNTYRFVMSQTRMLLSSELVRISSWRGWNKTHDTLL